MRWTKLKNLVEDRFAESMQGRVAINSARYGNCSCGHAWLTLDGELIANFCTRAYWNRHAFGSDGPEDRRSNFKHQVVEYGELSRQGAYEACWAFVHDLKVEQALVHENPLVQTLAVLDKRLGKRGLAAVDPDQLHPLARKLFDARVSAMQLGGIRPQAAAVAGAHHV